MSDNEDESLEAFLRSRAGQGRRRSKLPSPRRGSSPYLTDDMGRKRRLSSFTTSSGDETAISIDEAEMTEEEILETMKLHKQMIETLKTQPWRMKKKYRVLRKAKIYVQKHEGELAHSKRSKDIFAKYTILISRGWQRFKRELENFVVSLTPWEMRIKRIESHFGSVVASYFLFLRWVFWINLFITVFVCCFLMVPEVLRADEDPTGMRKEVKSDEKESALNLQAIWEFEGYLKYSPIFYGYYSNREKTKEGYRLPLAYFLTSLCVYIFSFFCILRRMAENNRMSKVSEKDDECIFTWKIYTGWDYMIGNEETAHNKKASLIMSLKEAILEEQERKKETRNWKIIALRALANFIVLILLVSSAMAVVVVVDRSQQPEAETSGWYRQNEVTVVVSAISMIYPNLFDLIGIMERYHPRVQLQWQLARILVLYLLNLYTLIFALFNKVDRMAQELEGVKNNITALGLMDNLDTDSSFNNYTSIFSSYVTSTSPTTAWGGQEPEPNCTVYVFRNCTLAALKRSQPELFTYNSTVFADIYEMWKRAKAEASYKSMLEGIANLTLNALSNWTTSRPDTSGISGTDTGGEATLSQGGYKTFTFQGMKQAIPDWAYANGTFPTEDYGVFIQRLVNLTIASTLAALNATSTPSPNLSYYTNTTANNELSYYYLLNMTNQNWTNFPPPSLREAENEENFEDFVKTVANLTTTGLVNYATANNWTNFPSNVSEVSSYLTFFLANATMSDFALPGRNFSETGDSKMSTFYTDFGSGSTEPTSSTPRDSENCLVNVTICPEMFETRTTLLDMTDTMGWDGTSSRGTTPGATTTKGPDMCPDSCYPDRRTRAPTVEELVKADEDVKTQLRKLCWETMFGQELVKLTVMDLVMTIISTLLMDFIRAVFVRYANNCWCWDLEKGFPGYGDFKIAENILHLVNNQGMIWMGMFFSPGLPAINTVKLCILLYIRSWAVLTCNIPHETVFKASRSNNFYFALLLIMLFLCTLPVGYAVVWLEPSWHCGPFSGQLRIYKIFTGYIEELLPNFMNAVLEYLTSPGVVIPLILLLVLIIYYLTSLTGSLREANNDLRLQLRREKNEAEKPPVPAITTAVIPEGKGLEDDTEESGEKKNGKKRVQYTDQDDAYNKRRLKTKKSQSKTDSFQKRTSDSIESKTSVNSDVPVITISQPYSDDPVVDDEGEETTSDLEKPTEESEDMLEEEDEDEKETQEDEDEGEEEEEVEEEEEDEQEEETSERDTRAEGLTTSESQEDTTDESSMDKLSSHSRPPLLSQTPLSFRSHTEHSRSVSPIHESLEELEGYSDEPMSGSYPTSQEQDTGPQPSPSILKQQRDLRRNIRDQQSSSRESSNSPARFPGRKPPFSKAVSEKAPTAIEDTDLQQAKLQRLATDSL